MLIVNQTFIKQFLSGAKYPIGAQVHDSVGALGYQWTRVEWPPCVQGALGLSPLGARLQGA